MMLLIAIGSGAFVFAAFILFWWHPNTPLDVRVALAGIYLHVTEAARRVERHETLLIKLAEILLCRLVAYARGLRGMMEQQSADPRHRLVRLQIQLARVQQRRGSPLLRACH